MSAVLLFQEDKSAYLLARALYSPARHLLLDDCLSAVDSHTALWIYENCITGPLMENRTCILVSHNIALALSAADHVIVLDKGAVKVQGTAEERCCVRNFGDRNELIRQSASRATSSSISRTTSMANLQKQVDIAAAVEIATAAEAAEHDLQGQRHLWQTQSVPIPLKKSLKRR